MTDRRLLPFDRCKFGKDAALSSEGRCAHCGAPAPWMLESKGHNRTTYRALCDAHAKKHRDVIPVVFHKGTGRDSEVTAVFPTLPATAQGMMTCYAHVGQHSACSREWYNSTRPAIPTDYAALKAELEGQGYVLQVCQRITPARRDALFCALVEAEAERRNK